MREIQPREKLDKSLNSGERQVSADIDGIDVWHRWRYEQAAEMVNAGDKVVDLGCGIGYGSRVLAKNAEFVLGVDDSEDAIEYARANYPHKNAVYCIKDIFAVEDEFDVVVAFEILEHTDNPIKFFNLLKRIAKRKVVMSTPHISLDAAGYPFHYRHYSEGEIRALFEAIGFRVATLEIKEFSNGKAVFCVAERI